MTTPHQTTRAVGLTVLLVLSVVGGSIAFSGVVAAEEHGNATLPADSLTEHRGDVVPIDVALNNTTTAYVSVTYEGEYGVLVEVVDGDEDGHVGLELNTHYARVNDVTAGVGLTEASAAAGDEYSVVDVTTPSEASAEPLPTGSYDVAVGVELGEDGDALAEEQDTMTVTLEEGSVDRMRIWTAPYDPLAFDTREQFVEEVGLEALGSYVTETDRIASGDYVVVQVDASGIYGQVDSRHDLTGVDEMGEESGIRLWIEEVNPSATSEEMRHVDLTSRDNTLAVDSANDTMFLLVNTHTDAFEPDTVYRATFELNETNALLSDDNPDETKRETVSETFAIVDRRATIETDGKFSRTASTTLRGTTTAAPGSQLTVELNSSGTDALPATKTVTVSDDGTFSTSFDLTGVPIGTNVTASVIWNDAVIGDTSGVVVQQIEGDPGETTAEPTDGSTSEQTTESTADSTPEPTPEPTTTDSTVGDRDSSGDDTATTGGESGAASPGFGVVATVVALLGAALLAARRRQ
ncbi:PGF-CTERM protein/surface glycoprotein [Halogranum amylolyticum]|uniref:PGF-CTERM protein/surface glycoprotein n=1 Tax=Halogranum amylolyticum TaxID=660520 RepID=A0A1H8WSI0_9EURY|nr:BGTF surface domain-containing protein [Halogranum amylolyticum]SEP30615.1 PGF-CTERM protein/surface glycoprotein [Halogranum amylolyticum]